MNTRVTFNESIENFAACEFLQVAEDFMRGEATIRDIDNARQFFVMHMQFEFGLSESEAAAVVRRVEWQCKLLGNASSDTEVIAAILRVEVQAGLLREEDLSSSDGISCAEERENDDLPQRYVEDYDINALCDEPKCGPTLDDIPIVDD